MADEHARSLTQLLLDRQRLNTFGLWEGQSPPTLSVCCRRHEDRVAIHHPVCQSLKQR